LLALLPLAALLFAGGVYLGLRWRDRAATGDSAISRPPGGGQRPSSRAAQGEGGVEQSEPPASGPAVPAGHLALVIDDLGRSLTDLDALAALGVPLSYSVLPFEEHTAAVVERLRADRLEILCHLPMQPGNGSDPGPGALLASMEESALAAATRAALARVPGAVGANNHMGSTFTADPVAMGAVLVVLQQEGLFFLDSRTSAESVGYLLARSLGLPAAERHVFLDDDPQPMAVRDQFRRLLDRARLEGAGIAIAHPHPATLAVLREEIPRARAEGFTFVPVSFLLDRTGEPL
jgi:hypothetical protein